MHNLEPFAICILPLMVSSEQTLLWAIDLQCFIILTLPAGIDQGVPRLDDTNCNLRMADGLQRSHGTPTREGVAGACDSGICTSIQWLYDLAIFDL